MRKKFFAGAAIILVLGMLPGAQAGVVARPALGPAGVPPLNCQPLHLIIVGPPGSGKSEVAKLLALDYGLIHVLRSEVLRAKALEDPRIAQQMKAGELVDAGLIVDLIRERLSKPDVREKGFILDGFPRRLEEAGALEALFDGRPAADALIRLDVSDDELARRVLARGRHDDAPEVFQKRMEIYRSEVVPAIRKLEVSMPVIQPPAEGSIQNVYAGLKARLASFFEARAAPAVDKSVSTPRGSLDLSYAEYKTTKRIALTLLKYCPPTTCVIVDVGRSLSLVGAYLRNYRPNGAYPLPLSSFEGIGPEHEKLLFEHFNRFLPDDAMLKGRRILLADFSAGGGTVVRVEKYVKKYFSKVRGRKQDVRSAMVFEITDIRSVLKLASMRSPLIPLVNPFNWYAWKLYRHGFRGYAEYGFFDVKTAAPGQLPEKYDNAALNAFLKARIALETYLDSILPPG